MIISAAEFQLRALDGLVDVSSPLVKSKPADIRLLRRLLDTCVRVAPLIIPPDPAMTAPVLNHPDISLNNLIVPPDGRAYALSVIDWQGATVSPFCMQCGVPNAISYSEDVIPVPRDGSMPPWPDNFDSMSPEEQQYIRMHHRYACRHRLYAILMPSLDPLRSDAWVLRHFTALEGLVPFITRCISDGQLGLQGLLIRLQQCWREVHDRPCPIDFSQEEISSHHEAAQTEAQYERNVQRLHNMVDCMNDGSVTPDQFDSAMATMERCRKEWDEKAMKGLFPLYEGAHSYYLV